ncbi:hypothetical protein B484DRAFT_337192, partial [Ochromonadaceae sp. CCMP2298]
MHAYAAIVDLSASVHSDLTGRFPVKSKRGNEYGYVSVHKGYIHCEPMATRTAAAYVKAVTRTRSWFADRGIDITIHRIDNETSRDVERLLRKAGVTIEWKNHRANKAERAIREWKNHFISMLCTTHPTFPLDLWDELLPQCELTLNLLRPYTVDPTISAYHGIHGRLLPRPCSLLYSRCFRVFTTQTQQTRISDSLAWLPTAFKMPGASTFELIHAAITNLTAGIAAAHASPLTAGERQPYDRLADTATTALHELLDSNRATPVA